MASHLCGNPKELDLLGYFDRWCDMDRLTLKPQTCGTKRIYVMHFLEWGGIQQPGQISFDQVQRFLGTLKPRYTARVIVNCKNAVSSFCSYLLNVGVLTENPCRFVKLPRVIIPPPAYLNKEDLQFFIRAAEKRGIGFPVKTAAFTGLRSAEMNNLQWADIDINQRIIKVFNRKGFQVKNGKNHVVPIMDKLLEEFKREMAAKKPLPNHYLFPSPRGPARRLSRCYWTHLLDPIKAIFPGRVITWRILRHTFASVLVQNGISVTKVAHWLGNSTAVCCKYYVNPGQIFDPTINLFPRQNTRE